MFFGELKHPFTDILSPI